MAERGFATSRGSEYEYNNENGFRRRSASPLFVLRSLSSSSPLTTSRSSSPRPFSSSTFSVYFGLIYIYAREMHRAAPCRAVPAASATTTKRDVSLYLLNCLLAPNSTLCSPLPRVSLMQADPSASATPPGVIMRAYRTV